MDFIFKAVRLCGAVVTAIVFFAGLAGAPVRASDELPIVGDIPMPQVQLPEVEVDVRVGDDLLPPTRPRFMYPRGPFAMVPPARFESPVDGPSVPPLEVARMLRSTGFSLLGPVNRRGWVYTVAVLNPRGDDGRAVIDARTGAIIRFIPALAVNSRINDELGVIYGPPGPPPVAQDFSAAPRPPKPLPRVAKRDPSPKIVTPKIAERAPMDVPPQGKPADAHAEMKPVSSPQPDVKPAAELKLWPTQGMPDAQTLE